MAGLSLAASVGKAGLTIASGAAQARAANQVAAAQIQQGNLIVEEGYRTAADRADDVRRVQALQAQAALSSGITLEGSPMLFMDEARRKGQEEIDAILSRANAQRDLIIQNAKIASRQGNAALTGSLFNAPIGFATDVAQASRFGAFNKAQTGRVSVLPTAIAGTQSNPLNIGLAVSP